MQKIHLLVLEQNGVPVANGQYLDMINIPYWPGSGPFPSVKVRMDFRGPDIGDFVYHCHILGHEDNGMMAIIRVNPSTSGSAHPPAQPPAAKAPPALAPPPPAPPPNAPTP